jgi:hypothetical protein
LDPKATSARPKKAWASQIRPLLLADLEHEREAKAVRGAMEQDWRSPWIIKQSPARATQPLDPSPQASQDSAASVCGR